MGAAASQCQAECTTEVADLIDGGSSEKPARTFFETDDDGRRLPVTNFRLLMAARDGNLAEVKRALAQGAHVDTRRHVAVDLVLQELPKHRCHRGVGLTPLMHAAQSGAPEVCDLLLTLGACANAEDEDGMRPLHFAAASGSKEACRVLLLWGADASAVDDELNSAFDHVPEVLLATGCQRREWAAILTGGEQACCAAESGEENCGALESTEASTTADLDAVARWSESSAGDAEPFGDIIRPDGDDGEASGWL